MTRARRTSGVTPRRRPQVARQGGVGGAVQGCGAVLQGCRAPDWGPAGTAAGPAKSGQGHTRAAKLAQTGPRLVALIKSQDLG